LQNLRCHLLTLAPLACRRVFLKGQGQLVDPFRKVYCDSSNVFAVLGFIAKQSHHPTVLRLDVLSQYPLPT
jgi:hypothetical protein